MILTKSSSLRLKASGSKQYWRKLQASFLIFVFFCLAGSVSALTIKLASPFPEATEWNNALLRMAEEWREITDGLIKFKIYPGGIAGNEDDIIRKMRMGQLDAGVFSALGLRKIVPETFVMTLPGLIQDDRELNFVLDNFVWRFDESFREEGFEILAWSQSGWAHVYSDVPVTGLTEFKRRLLAIDSTENSTISGFKSLGLNVIPVGINETIIALQSGLADSVVAPPILAAAFQWFAFAPYMTDLSLIPVFGGVVFSRKAWLKVPSKYRNALRASMARFAWAFNTESVRLNDSAMAVMKDNGLQMVVLNEGARKEWQDAMISWHDSIVGDGKDIPVETYERLLNEVEKLRSK